MKLKQLRLLHCYGIEVQALNGQFKSRPSTATSIRLLNRHS